MTNDLLDLINTQNNGTNNTEILAAWNTSQLRTGIITVI